jgi:hypothetical protein
MLAFLAQVVLQVSGYQSVILATILLVLMVVLAVMGGGLGSRDGDLLH